MKEKQIYPTIVRPYRLEDVMVGMTKGWIVVNTDKPTNSEAPFIRLKMLRSPAKNGRLLPMSFYHCYVPLHRNFALPRVFTVSASIEGALLFLNLLRRPPLINPRPS